MKHAKRKPTKLQLNLDTVALLSVRGGDGDLKKDTQFASCGSNGCDTWTATGGCPTGACV